MKIMRIILHKDYEIEVKDDYDLNKDDGNDLHKRLEEQITSNNQTINNEFFENLSFACRECGITLSLDEEKEDGICVSCDNM